MKRTIFLSLLFVLAAVGLVPAETRHVPSEYATIQAAIDDCNDGDLDSWPDVVGIVIGNHAPVADAGPDRYAGAQLALDGTGSYDPDGYGTLSYQWQQISGPEAVITDACTATPTVAFTQTRTIQHCEFELVVSDGDLTSLPDVVGITVIPELMLCMDSSVGAGGLLMYYKFDGSLGADLPSPITDDSGNDIEFTKYAEGAGSVKYGQSNPIVVGSTASADFFPNAGLYRLDPCDPEQMDALRLAGEQYTIELWMKPERLDESMGDRITLIGKPGSQYYWEPDGCKSWKIDIRDPGGSRELRYFHHGYDEGESGLVVGEWHHVAGVYDRTAGEERMMEFYLDGEKIEGGSWSELNPADNNEPVGIGLEVDRDGTIGHFFDGLIDEVRIFDIALRPCQFQLTPAPDEYATCPDPEDGEQDVWPCGVVLSWRAANKAKWHDVYAGTDFNDVNDANTSASVYRGRQQLLETYYSLEPFEFGQTVYWRIDEVNDPNMWKGDVWSFTAYEPYASNSSPADGAKDVACDVELSWSPGFFATSHDVYLGTDWDDVNDANTSSSEYKGRQATSDYDPPGLLDIATTHYWRIDEVNDTYGDSKGDVWSFTCSCLMVDDMDSYENIYEGWLPAADCLTNAYLYLEANTPVLGKQSMKYEYDNSMEWGVGYYAEAETKDLEPNDWTQLGPKVLSLWFYGKADNYAGDTEQMYLGVEDTAFIQAEVRYGQGEGEDMNDIKVEDWQEWTILLSDINDANLAELTKLFIGFGIRGGLLPGGWGTVYFDDIRLYPARCVPEILKPIADLSDNCIVDLADVEIMAGQWLQSGENAADIFEDSIVNLKDFAVLANSWLDEQLWPPEE